MPSDHCARERLRRWDPLDPAQLADPYPTFALARRSAPVFYNDYLAAWCVTRYDDVLAAVADTAALSSRQAIGSGFVPPAVRHLMPNGYPWNHPSLVNNDPPGHGRIRKLVNTAFRPALIEERSGEVTALVDGLLSGVEGRDRFDVVAEIAATLPQLVICRLLGVPDEHAPQLTAWSEDKVEMINPVIEECRLEELARGQADFHAFCDDVVTREQGRPRSDSLLSRLVHAHEDGSGIAALTRPELISIVSQLLLGGNSTTRRMLSTMVYRLLQHPAMWHELQRRRDDVPAAVEECLRYNSSVKGLYRDAVTDVEIAGTHIPAGSRVVVVWASANHDESRFVDPDRFDIHRADARRHLAFSKLTHFCLGAPLARLELTVTLDRLLERMPDLRLAPDVDVQWEPLALHAGLVRLDVDRARG